MRRFDRKLRLRKGAEKKTRRMKRCAKRIKAGWARYWNEMIDRQLMDLVAGPRWFGLDWGRPGGDITEITVFEDGFIARRHTLVNINVS